MKRSSDIVVHLVCLCLWFLTCRLLSDFGLFFFNILSTSILKWLPFSWTYTAYTDEHAHTHRHSQKKTFWICFGILHVSPTLWNVGNSMLVYKIIWSRDPVFHRRAWVNFKTGLQFHIISQSMSEVIDIFFTMSQECCTWCVRVGLHFFLLTSYYFFLLKSVM